MPPGIEDVVVQPFVPKPPKARKPSKATLKVRTKAAKQYEDDKRQEEIG
jgi:hypothetical protein